MSDDKVKEHVVEALKCPYCERDDQTAPLARIGKHMMEWICYYCGMTWNVKVEE